MTEIHDRLRLRLEGFVRQALQNEWRENVLSEEETFDALPRKQRDRISRVLSAQTARVLNEFLGNDYVVIPKNPHLDMVTRGYEASPQAWSDKPFENYEKVAAIYTAMVKAALEIPDDL